MSNRRLVYTGVVAGAADAHTPTTLTATPPANKHVQDTYVVEFVNAIAQIVNVTVQNNDGTNDCNLTSFSIAASTNESKIVQGLFVPRVSKFVCDPAANGTGNFTVNVYESEANI